MKLIHLMGMCLFSVAAMAQTETDTTKTYLDEVVVSVNRWEQNQREISTRVTKITPAFIQLQNPQTSADLLGLSNQVFIQKSQLGGGSPMIRGFATNRILLVVDGVRMNNAIFRSGNLQNVISLDANSIQNTEVVFGPGSVVYGSDAIGGVMNFTTLTPTLSDSGLKFSGDAFTRYASANEEKTGHVDFSIGLKKWAFVTSITKSDFSDLKMGSHGPIEYTRPDYQVRDENGNDITVINPNPNVQIASGYNQFNGMQKIRFAPNANWDFNYGFHYSKTSDVPRYDRLILKNGSNVFTSAEWYYGPQKWLMHSLQAQFNKHTAISNQIKLTAGYQDYEESRHNRNFTGGNRNRRTDRFERVKAFSVNVDADKQLNEKANLFYGLEYVTNTVGSTAERVNLVDGTVSGISTRYPDGSTWRSMAAYASMRYTISSKWIVNGSARYTHVYTHAPFDTEYFDFQFTEATLKNGATNGSLGVAFNPTSKWKIYANASTGFRAPNVDDIGKVFDSQPGTVVVPNPTLKPETAYNTEIGFTGKIGGLTLDASAFYTLLDNAIVRGPFTFNGQTQIDYDGTLSDVLALQNISELTVRGVQLGLRWDFNENFQLASNLNLQKGKEKNVETGENVSPTHVAPSFGSTRFSFTNKKIRLMLYANYNGEIEFKDLALSERADSHLYAKDADGNPYAPAWATLNFKSSFEVAKLVTIDAGIENILDKRYRPYSSGITAPGRNFIFALRVKV
ncbi:MAG: TonB-dependent receptor [Cyclobacteriaceae bacterium]|nr:TonB-dependent receptor [Cyclobacteriaceae bacterium]